MSQTAILRMSEQAVLNIVKFVKVTINFEISNIEIRSILNNVSDVGDSNFDFPHE